jgi:hypothetical protein
MSFKRGGILVTGVVASRPIRNNYFNLHFLLSYIYYVSKVIKIQPIYNINIYINTT